MKPRYNEPLYNKVLYITKPLYSEQILPCSPLSLRYIEVPLCNKVWNVLAAPDLLTSAFIILRIQLVDNSRWEFREKPAILPPGQLTTLVLLF